jgi:hypothetical protein
MNNSVASQSMVVKGKRRDHPELVGAAASIQMDPLPRQAPVTNSVRNLL